MQDLVVSQVTLSAVVVVVLQWLKRSPWFPWLTDRTEKAKHVAAVLGAAATAVGVHYTYDASIGTLTITGVTLAGIGHGAWHWLQSYAFQESLYKGVFRDPKHPAPEQAK
jgi:hypothetical protein